MIPIPSAWQVLSELVLEQYKESPKYLGTLQLFAAECDRLETARWELSRLLAIDQMEGAQLDLLGKVGNAPTRSAVGAATDADYRAVLRAAFRARISGTPEEIIEAVKSASRASSVLYIPDYPAGFWIISDGPVEITQAFLDSIAPAGVRANLPCYLSLENGDPLTLEDGDYILVRGPCPFEYPTQIFPEDRAWDGGVGAIDPGTAVFTEAWPFRDGTGVGEYPDGGSGLISPPIFTFTDGSYAEDTGGA